MRLLSALFDAVLLPVSMVQDFFTLGGIALGEGKSATRKRIEDIEDNLT